MAAFFSQVGYKSMLEWKEEIVLFDSEENEYVGSVASLGKGRVLISIKTRRHAESRKVKITVACAIPKKSKMDDIVDNLTQLGVDAIVPLETERVIVRLDENKKAARLARWRKIARAAAQQSQRNRIPDVGTVSSLASVLARAPEFDLKLIPTLADERKHISAVLAGAPPESVLVLIGPEGDFSPQEVGLAKKAGFIPVSLGDSILRVGVAAVAVASYLKLSLGS